MYKESHHKIILSFIFDCNLKESASIILEMKSLILANSYNPTYKTKQSVVSGTICVHFNTVWYNIYLLSKSHLHKIRE